MKPLQKIILTVIAFNINKAYRYTVFYRIHPPPQIDAPSKIFFDHIPEVSRPDLRVSGV